MVERLQQNWLMAEFWLSKAAGIHLLSLIFTPLKVEMRPEGDGKELFTWRAQIRTIWMWGWTPQRQLCVSARSSEWLCWQAHTCPYCVRSVGLSVRSHAHDVTWIHPDALIVHRDGRMSGFYSFLKIKENHASPANRTSICHCHKAQTWYLSARLKMAERLMSLALWHEKKIYTKRLDKYRHVHQL